MNILLAEKTSGSRSTRNRAGKTSLIEIIHFLFGGKCGPDSVFRLPELREHEFWIEGRTPLGQRLRVSRSGLDASFVMLQTEATDYTAGIADELDLGLAFGRDPVRVPEREWRQILESRWFPNSWRGPEQGPRFGNLFSYFVRNDHRGGFRSPFKSDEEQSVGEVQKSVLYLLGLSWPLAARWQDLRVRQRNLQEMNRASKLPVFQNVLGSAAELTTRVLLAENRLRRFEDQLAAFNVHEQYGEMETRASELTRQMNDLTNENALDRQYLEEIAEHLRFAVEPAPNQLEALYHEAGVVLPELVFKRFEEVREFHASVIRNRRSYIEGEMREAARRIQQRNLERIRLDKQRANIMAILKSHGALESFLALEGDASRQRAEAEMLRNRLNMALEIEQGRAEIAAEQIKLRELLQQDISERRDTLSEAIVAFEELSVALYNSPGRFFVEATKDGPKFNARIEGGRSKGIRRMTVFCFDMVLMRLCGTRGIGPGFLVHDSHLFDGVDSRQIRAAIEVGEAECRRLGVQYIVTMNSDVFPADFSPSFPLDQVRLPVSLTDAEETGGLFGLKF